MILIYISNGGKVLKGSFLRSIKLNFTPGSGWEGLGFESGHTKDFVLTAPQPVLVIMSLTKGNALALKRCSSYLIQWTSRQRWYNSKSWLSDEIKGYKTYGPF